MAKSVARQTLRIYWQHAWKYKLFVLGIIFVTPMTMLTYQILPPLIASRILDRLSTGNFVAGNLWGSVGHDILLYASLIIFGNTFLWRLGIYLIWRLEMQVERDLARDMFNHLISLDMNFHANSFGGSLVSRTSKFVGAYMRVADTIIFQIYNLITVLIFSSIVMWSKSPLYVVTLLFCSSAFVLTANLSYQENTKTELHICRS